MLMTVFKSPTTAETDWPPHTKENVMNTINRRQLLKFIGASSALASAPIAFAGQSKAITDERIAGIAPTQSDDLELADGLSYEVIISDGDHLGNNLFFGAHNDYLAWHPLSDNEAILWVNHEYINPLFIGGIQRSKENIDQERLKVGGSLIKLKRTDRGWQFISDDRFNRRIDGTTRIPFAQVFSEQRLTEAEGTMANCAGGVTPWGSILTCEENYDMYYGERQYGETDITLSKWQYGWEKFYPNNLPEHYGWVVEIDPETGEAQKHLTLGRFAHESATCVLAKTGNTVVYSGDDKNDECLYKFIASEPNSLTRGTLYVANLDEGRWLSLNIDDQPILKEHFKDQEEVLTYARKAAELVGGSKLDRPEDIEIHPHSGEIFIALTNNKPRKNYHGQILKIRETDGHYESLTFDSEVFLIGSDNTFSSPDNLAFDQQGNLWFATDISGSSIGKGPYKQLGNNGLFLVPASGPQAGEVIQVASAPMDAELTGLCFSPNDQSLLLSVQHPGEQTKLPLMPTSRWPKGEGYPLSSVVEITGIDRIIG